MADRPERIQQRPAGRLLLTVRQDFSLTAGFFSLIRTVFSYSIEKLMLFLYAIKTKAFF